ncbi:hypothetical protein DMC30DRAFT_418137 [Rhodotorula diobovata]|uniref:ML-like domain-containing protein n=1 Tax=Rhodotorula diobovata TaxID=5288 RepID=A0A5C5FS82_9BASI|nr:hypothetical protein DMC30DRAFT_418137 [Rhodotorula diobovata]
MRVPRGLHALTLLSLASQAQARRRFYARAVSYCSDARAIEVDQFLLQYYPDESLFGAGAGTISFDIAAASVDPNLNAKLEFSLDAYGIDAVNTTINLCSLLGGILCPLPTYDFVGSATLPLPAEVGDSIDIPSVGYWIPDLQATATVRLLRVEDDSEAACLRVDLSNGKTVRFASVSWALGGLAIGCVLLSALWFLVGTLVWPSTSAIASSPHANALWASLGRRKERLLLFMSLVQFVATTGLLSIQYPRIYESFTGNFAWALGLIRINPVIRSIDRMRDSTGGNLTQIAGTSTLVGGTDALKSIFSRDAISLPPAPEVATAIFSELARSIAGSPARATEAPFLGARSMSVASALLRRQLGIGSSSSSSVESDAPTAEAIAVPEVQNTSTIDSVRYGIPHYLVNIDISPYDAFMIVFINFLFLCAIAIALALLGGALWALVRWVKGRKAERRRRRLGLSGEAANVDALYAGGKWGRMRKKTSGPFLTVLRANTFRLLLIAWYPLLLFTFFQWTIGSADSWAPIVLSVFTSVFTTAAVFILAARFFVLARRAVRPSFGSVEDPASFDAPPTLSYPFGSAPSTPPATPNPEPKRALLKAERRQIETWECGRFLASGLAPYSPLWNAHKVRSRRTTAKRRNWFKARGWWFGLVELVLAPLVTALFVGFAHRSGWTQTIAVLVIQSLLLLALCIWTPYDDKSSNGTRILWALLRVVIAGALIPFNRSLGLNEIVRVAIGAILMVIEAVAVVLFFVLLVIDFVQLCVFLVRGIKDRRRHRGALAPEEAATAPPAGAYLAPGEKPPSPRPTGYGLGDGLDAQHGRGQSLDRGVTTRSSTTLEDEAGRPVAGKSLTP